MQLNLASLRRLGHRRALVMLDQATSSLTNVVVTIIVARLLAPSQFGAFSLAVIAYQLGVGAVRAVVGEPWLSAHSTDEPVDRARAMSDLVRAAVASSAACSLLIAVVAALVGGAATPSLVALALLFPCLGVQDALRFVAVVDRPQVALVSDFSWLVVAAGLMALAPHDAGPSWFVAAWGIGGVIGLAIALALLSVSLVAGRAGRWFSAHRVMSAAYLGEYVSARALGHVVLVALGAIAGLPALGSVRAAQVFYGPLNTLFGGVYLALVPDGARRRHEPGRLMRLMVGASIVVTGAALAWTIVGIVLPDGWGSALFGDTWAAAEEVMLPIGLATIFGSASAGAFAGIRSLGAARLSLKVRLWSMPPLAGCALIGAFAGAAVGYSVGFAAGKAVVAMMWWVSFVGVVSSVPRDAESPMVTTDGDGLPVGLGG